jgi:hypothetical protein
VELAVAVALSRACRDEDEGGDLVLALIQRRGTWATLGCAGLGRLGRGAGLLCRLLLGCGSPIGRSLFFLFSLLFSVFLFCICYI